jgi:hypothetical protein
MKSCSTTTIQDYGEKFHTHIQQESKLLHLRYHVIKILALPLMHRERHGNEQKEE